MRYFKIVIALLFFSIGLHFSALSQQDTTVLKSILEKTKRLSETQPIEKVYVHFDKPYYSVADTIWFKAYLTSEQNMPSQLSKVVYVDVMNSQDSLITSIKLPVANSVAAGNIPLDPGTFKQANYYVKAYTVWMLNSSPDYFFTKTIAIGDAVDKKLLTNIRYNTTLSDKTQTIKARIQFKNEDKIAYANKPVNWRLVSAYDVVSKGRGTTDANGFLNVEITARKDAAIKSGELITDLAGADKEVLTSSFSIKPQTGENDLQFFPEGGEFYRGMPTQIAFKAIKPNGMGIDLTGAIIDGEGNQVTTMKSSHLGMGSFYLNAEANKTYKAKVTFKDGTTKTVDIPQPKESGINLQINNSSPQAINVKLVANQGYFDANKGKALYLVAQHNNIVYYAAQTVLQNQVTAAKIPKDKFPSGIVQISLFSAAGEPVSERLAFVMHPDALKLTVKTDLPAYKARGKVKMTVAAADSTKKVAGDFSVTVIDEQKVPSDEDAETTILSSLLLTSDLQGYIERPNYYFNKTDDKKLADLDVLMLTQGYRRFTYKEILANKFPPVLYFPEQGMEITGTLRDRTGMPVKKAPLRLTVTGKTYSAETITSPSGLFAFKNLNIPDSSEVVVSAKYNANGHNMMIMVDPAPSPANVKNQNMADEVLNIDSNLSSYLNNSKKQYSYLRTLKEVVITGAPIKKVTHADYSSLASLSMMADHLIDGERLKDCRDLITCLKTMATGLTFMDENFYVTRSYNAGDRTPVQIFLGGSPVDLFSVNSVNGSEIESVEVFLKDELGTVFRTYNTNGVVSINLKKVKKTKMSMADLKKMLPQDNVIKFTPQGYSKQREFYAPKYTAAPGSYNRTDLRSTIYWNPKVVTEPVTGVSTFEFYNADGKGSYKAVVEGIDKDGNIGRSVFRYTVK
jgi:hypothetical protein